MEYDEVTGKKILEEEELKAVEDEVHVPADVTAQMFWLSNRRRDRWAYRPEKAEEVEQNDTGIVVLPPVLERPEPGQTETEEGNAG